MPKLKPRELRPVVTYDRDAVLDLAHIAAAFGVSEELVAALDLPCFYVGQRPRFVWGQVLDEVRERAHADAQPSARRTA